jgi:hypothetical protein
METISHDYESTGPLPPPPPHTHTENCVCDVSICKSGGGDFIRNAAKMFSFDPIPTRTKKPGPLLLVYFMFEIFCFWQYNIYECAGRENKETQTFSHKKFTGTKNIIVNALYKVLKYTAKTKSDGYVKVSFIFH